MPADVALDIFLDALKDSALVFAFVLLIHVLLSFFEEKLALFLTKHQKLGPLFGSLFGLVPQCGTSVMGSELYIKKYISLGTLMAIFLSCSDEAFIAILTSGKPDKILMVLPLIGLKFAIGFLAGLVADLILNKKQEIVTEDVDVHEESCSTHHMHNSKIHQHVIHPLIHSLVIFGYVLAINLALGYLIGFIGEENFASFLNTNKYLTPLFAPIVGLIPNCASSLLLAELYIEGHLSFGAILGGLLVNAGLGMMVLLKNKESAKKTVWILLINFAISVAVGYITCLIIGF